MNNNSDLNLPFDKGDGGISLPDSGSGQVPSPEAPVYIPPETVEIPEAPEQLPEEGSPEADTPEDTAPEELIDPEPVPDEAPQEEIPVETEQVQLYTETVQQEQMIGPEDEQGMGFWPTLLLGCLLGAAVCALVGSVLAWLVFKPKKSAKLANASFAGAVAQGIGSREDQQDALFLSDTSLYHEQGILMCVADGMGGLINGGMYSSTAVSAVAKQFISSGACEPRRLVAELTRHAVAEVNRAISPNYGSGGTTFLLGLLYEGRFYFSSIGDSRICLYRDGELISLNRQHTYEDELLLYHLNDNLSYDSAVNHEKSGALTSYLGMGTIKYVDIPGKGLDIKRGDRIVLMSDGVFNTLSDSEIAAILSQDTSQISNRLKRAIEAKNMMYQDNYSAVIVAVD